jgi:nucleoid-associated protein YgaU
MRSRLFHLFVLASLIFVVGCERSDTSPFTAEIDEPGYRRGKELIKQGRNQEALSEFQKVIDKRGLSNSPESHLEVGLLYQYHIKDPIAAIFHYRKFRELKPNSQQADLVRQRIDAATRDFAKTLPGQPLENQLDRLDMSDEMLRLKRENEKLKTDLAAARAGKATSDAAVAAAASDAEKNAAAAPETPAAEASNDTSPVVRASLETDAVPVAATQMSPPSRPAAAPVQTQTQQPQPTRYQTPPATAATTRPATTTPQNTTAATRPPTNPATTTPRTPVGAYRRCTIAKGDTLFSLAQRYYGNRSRWRDIYAANRDVMKSEGDLRIGMEVRIPQ